eukprot:Tbor_TRINITY_DN2896_c0_g1::TRINITY_DN2896_c0_g1_i1::g.23259::m.23259
MEDSAEMSKSVTEMVNEMQDQHTPPYTVPLMISLTKELITEKCKKEEECVDDYSDADDNSVMDDKELMDIITEINVSGKEALFEKTKGNDCLGAEVDKIKHKSNTVATTSRGCLPEAEVIIASSPRIDPCIKNERKKRMQLKLQDKFLATTAGSIPPIAGSSSPSSSSSALLFGQLSDIIKKSHGEVGNTLTLTTHTNRLRALVDNNLSSRPMRLKEQTKVFTEGMRLTHVDDTSPRTDSDSDKLPQVSSDFISSPQEEVPRANMTHTNCSYDKKVSMVIDEASRQGKKRVIPGSCLVELSHCREKLYRGDILRDKKQSPCFTTPPRLYFLQPSGKTYDVLYSAVETGVCSYTFGRAPLVLNSNKKEDANTSEGVRQSGSPSSMGRDTHNKYIKENYHGENEDDDFLLDSDNFEKTTQNCTKHHQSDSHDFRIHQVRDTSSSFKAPSKDGYCSIWKPTSRDLYYYPLTEPGGALRAMYGPGKIIGNERERRPLFTSHCGPSYNLDLIDKIRERERATRTPNIGKIVGRDHHKISHSHHGTDTSQLVYKDQKFQTMKLPPTMVNMSHQRGRSAGPQSNCMQPLDCTAYEKSVSKKRRGLLHDYMTNYKSRDISYLEELREQHQPMTLYLDDTCVIRQAPAYSFGRSHTNRGFSKLIQSQSRRAKSTTNNTSDNANITIASGGHSASVMESASYAEVSTRHRAPNVIFPRTNHSDRPITKSVISPNYKGTSDYNAKNSIYDIKDTQHIPNCIFGPLVSRKQREKALAQKSCGPDEFYNTFRKEKAKLVPEFVKVPGRK